MPRRALVGIFCVLWALAGGARADEPVTVFAAASLANAMEAAGHAYEEKTGQQLRFSLASSSTLARQIEAGAPAQIFVSANEKWMDYLAERSLIVTSSRTSPISNRLVLIAPKDSELDEVDLNEPVDLPALLGAGGRLAMGDPAHVPAGIYAREALMKTGLWEVAEPRLARANDVRAALVLVERGEAPLGIVYATDAAVSGKVRIAATVPETLHTPISYPFAVIEGRDSAQVRALFAFLTGAEGKAIFARFGFSAR